MKCKVCKLDESKSKGLCVACYQFDAYHRLMRHGPSYFATTFTVKTERATARLKVYKRALAALKRSS